MIELDSFPLALGALALGFLVLAIGGDILVRGAAQLARRLGVPALLVGLTIVAFGTSAPELFVSLQAVLTGAPELALGNIVGSNIANILLVLGLPALIYPIVSNIPGVARNAIIGLLISLGLVGIGFAIGAVNFLVGALLFLGIIVYVVSQGLRARSDKDDPELKELNELDELDGLPESWPKIIGFVVIGIISLPIGATLIVDSSTSMAGILGVPNEVVGLTAVAFGTSLPELAATLAAARRKHTEVAVGNVLGSNIFNILAVGGAAGMAGTIPIAGDMLTFDMMVMVATALLLTAICARKLTINRAMGAGLIALYGVYVVALAWREGLINA
jgi:cation:H+ antiporter